MPTSRAFISTKLHPFTSFPVQGLLSWFLRSDLSDKLIPIQMCRVALAQEMSGEPTPGCQIDVTSWRWCRILEGTGPTTKIYVFL
jgi:hypothetical protein